MTEMDEFYGEVAGGLAGKNEGIPIGRRLSLYITLRKAMNYVWGGFTGSGKTSIVDEMNVLDVYDQLRAAGMLDRFRCTYWSMERRKVFKIAKWHTRRIFRDSGKIIPMERMLGWVKKEVRLSPDEHDLILSYKNYFEEMFEYIKIIDGRQNPTGIRKYLEQEAKKYGKIERPDEFTIAYIPNNPELLYLNVFDHVGKLKLESGKNKKETIDAFSDDCSNIYRDRYGMADIIISQFNRDINNPMRLKAGDVEPRIEDFKDTGDLAEDADVVISLFDPWRYVVPDPSGYDLTKLRDADGTKKYRNVKILKNSYGAEGVRVGMAYQPQTGIFKEMPKLANGSIPESVYRSIIDNSYFL